MCHANSENMDTGLANVDERFLEFEVQGQPLYSSLFGPAGIPIGTIIVLPDVFGRSPFYRNLSKILAAAGFVTIVPELFSRLWPVADGDDVRGLARLKALDNRETLADLDQCSRFLHSEYPTLRTGMLGFCFGGTVSLLAASRQELAAVVVYYGIPGGREKTKLQPFDPMEEVEDLGAPLLGFWGDQDERVPMDIVRRYASKLESHGKKYEIVIYPGLGHAFLTFDQNDSRYHISSESWARTIRFLKQQLLSAILFCKDRS